MKHWVYLMKLHVFYGKNKIYSTLLMDEVHLVQGYEDGYFHFKCTRSHILLFINFETKKSWIDHKAVYWYWWSNVLTTRYFHQSLFCTREYLKFLYCFRYRISSSSWRNAAKWLNVARLKSIMFCSKTSHEGLLLNQ